MNTSDQNVIVGAIKKFLTQHTTLQDEVLRQAVRLGNYRWAMDRLSQLKDVHAESTDVPCATASSIMQLDAAVSAIHDTLNLTALRRRVA